MPTSFSPRLFGIVTFCGMDAERLQLIRLRNQQRIMVIVTLSKGIEDRGGAKVSDLSNFLLQVNSTNLEITYKVRKIRYSKTWAKKAALTDSSVETSSYTTPTRISSFAISLSLSPSNEKRLLPHLKQQINQHTHTHEHCQLHLGKANPKKNSRKVNIGAESSIFHIYQS